MLTREQLEKGLKEIPPLPTAVAEILELLNQEGTDMGVLESKISKDPSLATRVLAIANSPFYGMPGRIASIRDACMVLGISSLRQVALAAGVMNNFPPNSGNQISYLDIWSHSLGTATAAKLIAARIGADKEIAFTAGLLHDVGRMVLDYCFPDEYEQVITYLDDNDCFLYEAEQAVLGVTHGTAGEIVAKRWRLPDTIATVIKDHHAPAQESDNILVELVRAGDYICPSLEMGEYDDALLPELAESTMRHLGIDMPTLMECLAEAKEMNRSSGALFG